MWNTAGQDEEVREKEGITERLKIQVKTNE